VAPNLSRVRRGVAPQSRSGDTGKRHLRPNLRPSHAPEGPTCCAALLHSHDPSKNSRLAPPDSRTPRRRKRSAVVALDYSTKDPPWRSPPPYRAMDRSDPGRRQCPGCSSAFSTQPDQGFPDTRFRDPPIVRAPEFWHHAQLAERSGATDRPVGPFSESRAASGKDKAAER
jgi:hypothetical protein